MQLNMFDHQVLFPEPVAKMKAGRVKLSFSVLGKQRKLYTF